VLLATASVLALLFVAVAALPYFTLNEERFSVYWPKRWWLLLHISGGLAALLAGPVQLWLGLSDRKMNVHRQLGLVYMGAIGVSSIGAFYLAFNTDFGWLFGASLVGLACAWLLTTGLAFVAARKFLFDQHKEWMIRSYVVTFAFVTFRIVFSVLQGTAASGVAINEQLAFAGWTCWTIPLLITEVVIQGRKIRAAAQ
jgi:hypothetical protein